MRMNDKLYIKNTYIVKLLIMKNKYLQILYPRMEKYLALKDQACQHAKANFVTLQDELLNIRLLSNVSVK